MSGRRGAAPRLRILVTGGSGQVGFELRRELAPIADVVAPPRAALDLADAAAVRAAVAELRPAVIANAAAYTAVDQAEREPAECAALNAEAPGVLAEAARRSGALLVHYSTDYVFDGRSPRPYREDDAPGPLQLYGATKLAGEEAVRAAGGAHVILRTSWVYGWRGRNFLRTMLRLAESAPEIRVVNDQRGAPTWSRMVAAGTAHLVRALLEERAGAGDAPPAGATYHMTAGGETSWHGFAAAIVEQAARAAGRPPARVTAIASAEYGAPAARPANSVLDCGRLADRYGIALPDWREQLAMALAE